MNGQTNAEVLHSIITSRHRRYGDSFGTLTSNSVPTPDGRVIDGALLYSVSVRTDGKACVYLPMEGLLITTNGTEINAEPFDSSVDPVRVQDGDMGKYVALLLRTVGITPSKTTPPQVQ